MSAGLQASLSALEDVDGVTGSFVFTRAGRVVARQLPPLFDDVALAEASGRLARLRDTFAAVGDDMDVVVLRFGEHKLYLKAMAGGMLCIVASTGVNMPAMRMAANLVGRRIGGALEAEDAAPAPAATGVMASALGDDSGLFAGLEGPPPVAATAAAPAHLPAPPGAGGARAPGWAPPGMRRFRGRPVG